VFRVVTDNENFEEFMPYVKQSDVERIAEGSIINYQYLDFPFPIGD
jgi:ribosome-associated toxin RatA of RatAB toxin-antitoxin module